MTFDTSASIVVAVQFVALILLTIGVYPYRIRTKNRNLIMHGFLAITSLILNVATVLYVMVPELASGASLAGASFLEAAIIVFHAVLGTVAVAAGAIIIAAWVTHPLGEMGCNPRWKWMIPTFAVWAAAFVLGVVLVVL